MNRSKHVNYDQIAATYDQRYAANGLPSTASALQSLCRQIHPQRVFEVGCGTGHWLSVIRSMADPPQVFGLDRSIGMLSQAHSRDTHLRLLRGTAEQLPFPEQSFDLVYCVNALHHFDDQERFIWEARRILRPGGRLAVVGSDPHDPKNHWYLYQYFPEGYQIDLKRFSPWERVANWMSVAGFQNTRLQPVELLSHSWQDAEIFQDPFLQKNSNSQLVLLSDEEYQAGLQRLQTAVEEAKGRGERAHFHTYIQLEMLIGELGEC